ncbi:aldehyde dehydrogenase [Roseococcus sp. SYP-B2431]|uniref:thiamine pyrophosphate-dependent enzyme n=1 Tax=Roseococcus sp. SYP-B2431 TaxID=2496640 RepID=UPI00103E19A4|nr:thiamine pyrophosphate-dependent enzyme [Roseococcus sp. SYP-B2431]TCH98977.1 aldehyde dehydrogenase [Roseococcus sp. SYP-B2431]
MVKLGASGKLDRRDLTRVLLSDRGDLLVVAGLGAPAWDISAVDDGPQNLPLWGGMGGAAMIGLGLALAQPDKDVLVLTGDGEMLMGIGSLATIAHQAPKNLSIVVQDNEHYGETGMQETATRHGTDLVKMAEGAGIKTTMLVTEPGQVPALKAALHAKKGPFFAVAKIDPASLPLALPPREGAILQARMREHLMGPAAHLA